MSKTMKTVEIPVRGMDCRDCAAHVRAAVERLPGVMSADALLASAKAVVCYDPDKITISVIEKAIKDAGYAVDGGKTSSEAPLASFTRRVLTLFGIIFGVVACIAVLGEWFGLFSAVGRKTPWWLWLVLIIAGGYPVFVNVVRNAFRGR